MDLKKYIRSIPDWPKKGILFRDITPLLADVNALTRAIEALCEGFDSTNIDYVAAVEARGFILGASIAERLGAGFIPIRKKGKLPSKTESITYELEYGTDSLEVHKDALQTGDRVLMFDDLLATGGTMAAACQLIEKIAGHIIGISFLIELADLKGRQKLTRYKVNTIISF
ncbi:MAG: adenine phosphoribosyltransferase [Planctomycetota bacterium]